MMHFNYQDLLNSEFNCRCGRKHCVPIRKIVIEKGAVQKIANILSQLGYHEKVHIVGDVNTYQAAGKQMVEKLHQQGYTVSNTYFDQYHLVAHMDKVQEIINSVHQDTECIIAVGSGTINDISRYAAYKLNKPYIIVATAPSMDGYASSVSPLIENGFKRTYSAVAPRAIIGDLDILCHAPTNMIASGFGDLIGKLICQNDWKISHVLNNEYYCEYVSSLINKAVDICIENAEGLRNRQEQAIENLMHGLILSGIGMLMIGNSRPASGCEHHLAHFLEMRYLLEGKEPPLHGEKVGVASVLMAKLYNQLAQYEQADIEHFINKMPKKSEEETTKRIVESFGAIADEVLKENAHEGDSQPDIRRIYYQWDKVKETIIKVPESNAIKTLLEKTHAPSTPDELGIETSIIKEGLEMCMYIRKRYTVLRLLHELNISPIISMSER